MEKAGYHLGIVSISLGVFFGLSLNATASTCEDNFEADSTEIGRWWISEGDQTIKAWDVEAKVCQKRKDEKAQNSCKARVNQKYYTAIRNLVKRRELKVQKAEEKYNGCRAKDELEETEEDIKK